MKNPDVVYICVTHGISIQAIESNNPQFVSPYYCGVNLFGKKGKDEDGLSTYNLAIANYYAFDVPKFNITYIVTCLARARRLLKVKKVLAILAFLILSILISIFYGLFNKIFN